MKLRIRESGKIRRTRNEIMDELEDHGYTIIDSGYEDYLPYEKDWKKRGYDVKSFYVKSDTPGLKMWVMYGKKR